MQMENRETPFAEVERDWIARARALKPLLEAAAPRIEEEKTIPPDVLDALHKAQMFRMTVPRSVGGAELHPAIFAQAVAAIAEGDASTAWCISQTAGSAMAAAYVEPDVAKELFGAPNSVFTWGFATGQPPCRAVPVKDGWIVNGTWTFASGNRVCQWLGGHAQLCDESGTPLRQPDGRIKERTMLFPRSSATVREDLWDVLGLAGTGSDTYSVTDLFVPTKYSCVPRAIPREQQLPEGVSAEPDPERREQGILYRFSSQGVFQAGLSSVAIGLARATWDEFVALAKTKSPSSATQSLRDDAWVQARIAQADAKISASSAWLVKLLHDAWHECETVGGVSFPLRIRLRTACTHQITEARDALDIIFLERRFRDIHTIAQQVQGNIARMQTVGQYYVGHKPPLYLMA
jgi:indole-3-acetate monooxygenase